MVDQSDLIVQGGTIRIGEDVADTTTDDISLNDLRDMLLSVTGVYGEILANDVAVDQTIGTSFVKSTAFDTNGENSGITPDHTNDRLTITIPGIYHIGFNMTAHSNADVSRTISAAIFFNQVEGNISGSHFMSNVASADFSTGMSGFRNSVIGDQIELYVKSASANTDLRVRRVHLWARRIG